MAWTDFLKDIDWGGMVQRAVPALIGANIATNANQNAAQQIAESNRQAALAASQGNQLATQQIAAANQRAAQLVADANQRAAQLATEANQRATQNITDANAQANESIVGYARNAQGQLQPIISATAPAADYLSRVMADTSLTPEQQQRIADTRRETANLLASRLGGRSATAVATRSAQDLENSIYSANRARSDQAANGMFGANAAARTNMANIDVGVGNQLAAGARQTGSNIAQITSGTGATAADLAARTGSSGANLVSNAGSTAAQLSANTGASQASALRGTGEAAAQSGLATGQIQGQAVGEVLSPSNQSQNLLDAIRSYSADQRKSNYSTGLGYIPRG